MTGVQTCALPISVTAQFLFPTLRVRIAASAAVQAAFKTSARRPVTGFSAFAPITMVSPLMAANPSICAPNWILTTSPFARTWSAWGSDLFVRKCKKMRFQKWTFWGHGSKSTRLNRTYAKGEKCATALFTEIDVGNDTPVCFLDKIYLQSFFFPKIKIWIATHLWELLLLWHFCCKPLQCLVQWVYHPRYKVR